MISFGLSKKVIANIFNRFVKVQTKWFKFIDISFLPKEMKEQYKSLIKERFSQIALSKI